MPYKFLLWFVSKKHYEMKIVLATLSVLIILPAFVLVVFASTGLTLVSSALASVNPVTKLVEIFDPNGNKVGEVAISATWPVRGYVSDEFGSYDNFRREARLGAHTGVDIANNFGRQGDPVSPFAAGRVVGIAQNSNSACGFWVRVDHGNHIQSLYCHLVSTASEIGKEVAPGDVIGYMGSTGASTGAHTHLQIEVYGIPTNPRTFLTGEPESSQR